MHGRPRGGKEAARVLDHMRACELVLLEQRFIRSAFAIEIAHAVDLDPDRIPLPQDLRDRTAEAAIDGMLLADEHAPTALSGGDNSGFIQWLDGRQVQEQRADALARQCLHRFKRAQRLGSGGDQSDVSSIAQHHASADEERLVLRGDDWRRISRQPEVRGAPVLVQGEHR